MVVVFGRPFVKRFALCYQTIVCPVCPALSVTLVYCGQTVGRIKMKLGMQVGLGPGHIVLDEHPAPLPLKGHSLAIFGQCSLWPNGWMDEDATWYGSRLRSRSHCIRRGPSCPRKEHSSPPPLFGPCLVWPWWSISATAELLLILGHIA